MLNLHQEARVFLLVYIYFVFPSHMMYGVWHNLVQTNVCMSSARTERMVPHFWYPSDENTVNPSHGFISTHSYSNHRDILVMGYFGDFQNAFDCYTPMQTLSSLSCTCLDNDNPESAKNWI